MDILQKIKQLDFNAYIKTELFLLLFINGLLPLLLTGFLACIPFLAIFERNNTQLSLGLILGIIFSFIILYLNINRIYYTLLYKKSYLCFSILNILSFVFFDGLAFVTSIFNWPRFLETYYTVMFL
jgi:hypothetical protein